MSNAQPTNETTTMSRFRVKGVNDEKDTCECCGKEGLKRVVWIEDTETLEVRHFGTSCAANPAKAFGLGREIKRAVREFDATVKKAKADAHNAAIVAACDAAVESFPGEWVEKKFESGRVIRIPADQAAFDAHKQAVLAAV